MDLSARPLKRLVVRLVRALGYRITPRAMPHVRYDNFLQLVRAYEARLREAGSPLRPDALRRELMGRLQGTPPPEAYYLLDALVRCREVEGDVCEFGVAQGETSALLAHEMRRDEGRRLHLFDSFEGLPQPTAKDKLKDDIFALGSMEAYAGTMAYPDDQVRTRLRAIGFPEERYVVHKGFVEDLLDTDPTVPERVAFAFVDFDFYEPICVALAFLDRVMPAGGRIVVDDYDFFSTGAKTATDEFLARQNAEATRYTCTVPNPEAYGHFAVLTKVQGGALGVAASDASIAPEPRA
jgi:hypothetical protein